MVGKSTKAVYGNNDEGTAIMMKKIAAILLVFALLGFSSNAYALQTCGTATASGMLPAEFFGFSISPATAGNSSLFPTVGFGNMRISGSGTDWRSLNPSGSCSPTCSGTFSFSSLDAQLLLAKNNNKTVILTLGFTPAWCSSSPGTAAPAGAGSGAAPVDIASGDNCWKNYITAVVNHSLASSTAHIIAYELWNEFDGSFWQGTDAQMVTLAKDAYKIIHTLDPNAKLTTPSVSSFSPSSGQGHDAFVSYFNAGGAAANAQDIVAIHSYPPGTPPDEPDGYIPAQIDGLRALMTTYSIGSEQIWYTEGGFNGSSQTTKTMPQQQAWMAQQYIFMWAKGVRSYAWFQWDNQTFGTMETSGVINSLGIAYGQVGIWLIGSTHPTTPCAQDSSSAWICNLTLSNGSTAEILFNNTSTAAHAIPSIYTHYQTLDSATKNNISGNSLALGIKPVLVIP